ncbi:MAG TPA: ThuA domain-containing protein [Allosphingosinicella sp.]|jgi:hypothetical protein
MTQRPAAILYSGGVGHPFAETTPVLAGYAQEGGWKTRIETRLEAMLVGLQTADLLIVNALYWSMTQDEKYAPLRDRWGVRLGDDQFARLDGFVAGGGRLLVIHTGTICWDTQPGWREIMGGGWEWGRSHHPPYGPVHVTLTEAGREISGGAPAFDLVDEAYHALSPAPDCTILATCDLGQGEQPLAWLRAYGQGQVAVDALGHDVASLTQPGHRALVRGQLDWLADRAGEGE